MTFVSTFEWSVDGQNSTSSKSTTKIMVGMVQLGRFLSDTGMCIALATKSWDVRLVVPYDINHTSLTSANNHKLNINREITCLQRGYISIENSDCTQDIILIGTATNLLAFNLETNSDVFYRDIPDGVNSLLFSDSQLTDTRVLNQTYFGGSSSSLVIVGGNCSVQAFAIDTGEEVFWTVTSANVNCMCFADMDSDGRIELVIGSKDATIKALKGEQIVFDITGIFIMHLFLRDI